jgi:3-hydroxyacyl-[acyl-carrier-protein] dehydratase
MLEITPVLTTIQQMKFVLIDKIMALTPGKSLSAVKSVSLAEEYLADHFPIFPVLPGVLLLEGLIESGSWLVRHTQDFTHSMVLLESARNVRYKSFAAPGMQIVYQVQAQMLENNTSSFTGEGLCGNEPIVEAKFTLRHFNLADENPKMARIDGQIIESMRQRWKLLYSE